MLRSLILFTTQASLLCSASYVVFMADAQAQDAVSALELVITPTRTPTPIKRVGSSVTVITEKDIEKSHKDTVADLLRNVPGIEIAQSGGQGQISRIFLRGTESNHTLVLIDGVEVNDPSSPDTAFDFAHLTTDNIERIEILRGPQGTLYGSEAIGGVINITTKKGKGLPGATAFVETGSFRHVKAGVGSSGEFGRFNYSAQVSRTNREGFTAVDERLGASEEDGYENTSFSSRVGATLTDTVSAHAAMRYADAEAEYDDGFPLQDANNIGKSQEFSGRGGVDVSLFEGRWKQEFSASYSNIERKNVDGFPRRSEGDRTKLDWLNHVALSPSQLVTLGMETEETTYKNRDNFSNAKASVRNNAVFVQDQLTLGEAFSTALGLRWDDHEEMGDEVTFRVAPSYLFAESGTRLKGSYGTGFKAPSLFELYDSFYGNRNLKPESSRGVDVGVEQSLLAGKLALGTTIFRNDIKDLINSDPVTFAAINVDDATTQGVEMTADWAATDALHLSAHYTFTDAEDDNTGQELLRRARHKFLVAADYAFNDQARAGLVAKHTGEREDSVFPGRLELAPYTTVDINASVDMREGLTLYGRVDNLFDKHYYDVYGYGTGGIAGYAGLKAQF